VWQTGLTLAEERMSDVVGSLEETSTNELGVSSTRQIAKDSGLPQKSVHRILRHKLHLFPYHLSVHQSLQQGDKEKRKEFAEWMLTDLDLMDKTLWTDEAYFSLNGEINNHNCIVWGKSKPTTVLTTTMFSPKVCVWIGVSSSFILEPYFFDGTVDGESYLTMLHKHVIPQLQRLRVIKDIIFMHDGAPPHIHHGVKKFLLQKFGNEHVISRDFTHFWPPRSPDLNPCDFWLWGALKEVVYGTRIYASIGALKQNICDAVSNISPYHSYVGISHLLDRLELVIAENGDLIEHLM
jgi:hypothetical protein